MKKAMLFLCLLTTACSAQLGSSRSRDLERELEALKQRVLELQRQATADGVEIDRLRQKVSVLEARLSEPRVSQVPQQPRPRDLDEESVPPLRPVEVIEVSDLEEPLDEMRADPADEESEPAGRTSPAPPPEVAAPSTGTGRDSPEPVSAAAQALYDQGYTLFHQGRLVDAEETFHRFLAAYSATDLADNAQYWIGESRLARNELQAALGAFRETVRGYPEGNKTPDALLKIGEVLERLGDQEGARASFRELIRRYPESPASERAETRLEAR